MECKGLVNWECGNTPGTEGEYCNLVYACDEDLVCHEDVCRNYADLLKKGTKETCKEGSAPGTLKVMSYNLFLINCLISGDNPFPCQHKEEQKKRIIPNLFNWMEQSDADVVMFQEVWSLTNEIIDGMTKAGFCHYLSNAFEKNGSGLQIFSKYPLEHGDFLDYYDFTGANSESVLDPEVLADKGIMYVKVEKNGKSYHIADTHTLSNTLRENHDKRMGQYEKTRRFVEEKKPNINDMVLYGGDMNEDKYNHHVGDQFYQEMLEELEASDPGVQGDQQYSYDTLKNPIPASFQEKDYEELLDYFLVSNKYEQPEQSSCEILIPQWPLDCDGKFECMISDHFPVLCTFVVSEDVTSATF